MKHNEKNIIFKVLKNVLADFLMNLAAVSFIVLAKKKSSQPLHKFHVIFSASTKERNFLYFEKQFAENCRQYNEKMSTRIILQRKLKIYANLRVIPRIFILLLIVSLALDGIIITCFWAFVDVLNHENKFKSFYGAVKRGRR